MMENQEDFHHYLCRWLGGGIEIFMNMNAIGIDVSKRKSTMAILRPGGKVIIKPFDVPHLS